MTSGWNRRWSGLERVLDGVLCVCVSWNDDYREGKLSFQLIDDKLLLTLACDDIFHYASDDADQIKHINVRCSITTIFVGAVAYIYTLYDCIALHNSHSCSY